MIVLDASAAVQAMLSKDTRLILGTNHLAAPHLVDPEVLHAMRRLSRGGTLSEEEVKRALQRWARLGVQRFPMIGLAPRIWNLRHNLSVYDACYVALAEALDCPLLTADARLARATGPACPITLLPR